MSVSSSNLIIYNYIQFHHLDWTESSQPHRRSVGVHTGQADAVRAVARITCKPSMWFTWQTFCARLPGGSEGKQQVGVKLAFLYVRWTHTEPHRGHYKAHTFIQYVYITPIITLTQTQHTQTKTLDRLSGLENLECNITGCIFFPFLTSIYQYWSHFFRNSSHSEYNSLCGLNCEKISLFGHTYSDVSFQNSWILFSLKLQQ